MSIAVEAFPSDSFAPTRPDYNLPARQHLNRSDLGLTLVPLTDGARARLGMDAQQVGVLVEDVAANSIAWERGITSGSVIVMVDRQPVVTSPADVLEAIETAKKSHRSFLLLLVAGVHGLHWRPLPLNPS